jgi:VWFA-related protein
MRPWHTHFSAGLLCCNLAVLSATAQTAPTPHTSAPTTQQSTAADDNASVLTVRSTLVQVPALVKTKKGELVFELKADDFTLTDDGVPQRLTLDEDTDSQPLALAVVVQTGGAAVDHLEEYKTLGPVLDNLMGAVEHRVAVIGFDSAPHSLLPFTASNDDASDELASLDAGDKGAAILDALAFAVAQLRTEPPRFRRAILLISETIDQGSSTRLDNALRLISDTNTAIYSFGFTSTRSEISHEAGKLNSDQPGPEHGCFSRDPNDPNVDLTVSAAHQDFDCAAELLPPLRLARIAYLAARNALRKNTAETIAQLTGGEFFKFHDLRSLQHDFIAAANDVPNHYVLSFTPTSPHAGLHTLDLQLVNRPQLVLKARTEYWIDSDSSH